MAHNTANYEEQGGSNWVVGGTLTITSDGKILIPDTTNGKTYQLTIENGVLTPVEV